MEALVKTFQEVTNVPVKRAIPEETAKRVRIYVCIYIMIRYTNTVKCYDHFFVVDVDECLTSNPCQNEAKCVNTPGSYRCAWQPGFTGENCANGMNT